MKPRLSINTILSLKSLKRLRRTGCVIFRSLVKGAIILKFGDWLIEEAIYACNVLVNVQLLTLDAHAQRGL